ncbi:MAG TPA: carboxypeptidase regulatory-like domain-containing protein, partial [Solirubrobacter sp.]
MHKLKLRGLTLMTVLAVAAAGCQGGKGAQGDAGAPGTPGNTGSQGPVGPKGDSAVVTGSIEGTITFDALDANNAVAQAGLPASAVTVETVPPVLLASGQPATAQTDATGSFAIPNVPIGVYAVKLSGTGYTTTTLNGVSVVAGKAASGSAKIVSANPLLLKSSVANKPFGFDQDVALSVRISGGKGPYDVTWTPKAANATVVTPAGAALAADPAAPTDATKAVATASIHTGTFKAILASNVVTGLAAKVFAPNSDPTKVVDRAGFVPVSMQQLAQMTYNVDVKVTDTTTKWQKVVTVAVPTASLAQGSGSVPVNTVVIAHLPGNAAAQTLTGPVTALNDASGEWPWFVASAEGDYTVGGLTVSAGNYVGSDFVSSTANPANCVDCHSESPKAAAIAGKFKEWSNSAHGNHFFKFMEYDVTGTHLQWKAGVTQLPTANPLMFWKTSDMPVDASGNPLPMTTFQFGMMGAEGAHYSSSCMGCHTTGYNAALASNGVDDKISADKWSFDLSKAFAGNLKTASATDTGEPVTVKPDDSVWKLIPADVKAYAGMQCEACHGPLGQHAFPARAGSNPAPRREFDVAACAICHDRPTNHDRVALWRQSGHANLEVAVNEAGTDTHGGVASCARCHAAQGFVEYLSQKAGVCTDFKDVAGAAITDAAKLPPLEGPLFIRDTSTVGKVICQVVDTNVTASKTASDTYLAARGLTSATIQPISCAACHDA